jgi:hypothetical protein
MSDLKTIKYRGGIAEFAIPAHWREEYEPLGGAMFYEDSTDSGTLRLSVLGFESDDTSAERMAATALRGGAVSAAARGFPLQREERTVEENGETLYIIRWQVAIPVPPRSLRLAIFSYTILLSQREDPKFAAEIDLLHGSISEGNYSQEQGEAGEYRHS